MTPSLNLYTLLTISSRSTGSNIFPSLVLVRDTVTIEAWNDDFNCSKLISQQNDRTINKLICNGTSNVIYNKPEGASSTTTLSKGAWAGIGVGIGVVVFTFIGILFWLVLHFRRLLKNLATRNEQMPSKSADVGDSRERGGDGVEGENSLQEMDCQAIVREKPDDHIARPHELPVPPAELANTPRSSEEGQSVPGECRISPSVSG